MVLLLNIKLQERASISPNHPIDISNIWPITSQNNVAMFVSKFLNLLIIFNLADFLKAYLTIVIIVMNIKGSLENNFFIET